MKTLFICLLSLFVNCCFGKIWRVNNNSNYNGADLWGDNFGGTPSYPVFNQLTQAIASNLVSATAGDTIYVEGSTNVYTGAANFNKKLVVIGPGYLLNENPNTANSTLEANIGYVYFDPGSEGSQMIGMHVTSSLGIAIYVSNITVKRNRIAYSVYVGYNISNINISQNFFYNANNSTVSAIDITSLGFPTDFVFNNNISKRTLILASGNTTYVALQVHNNVFDCPAVTGNPSIRLNTGSFKNNILKTSAATVNINSGVINSYVSHNISASPNNQFGTANNNIVVADMTTLFVDQATNTTDGDYQLKSSSPGSGNGTPAGTDRGAFGGILQNRYALSGLAAIPVVYDISTSGIADASGLPVTIKARTIQ